VDVKRNIQKQTIDCKGKNDTKTKKTSERNDTKRYNETKKMVQKQQQKNWM